MPYNTMTHALSTKGSDWNNHAAEYARLMEKGPMVTPIKSMLTSLNTLSPFTTATAILDVGCGPGSAISTLFSTHGSSIAPSARLIASDFSPAMIDQVRTLASTRIADSDPANHAWSRLETYVWDAQDLSALPDASLSHIIGSLIYFLVADPQLALKESRRVLASGGVITASSWARVQWLEMLDEAARLACPEKTAGRPAVLLPAGWASVQAVEGQLKEAGFKDVKAELVETFLPVDEPEELARWFVGMKNPIMGRFVEGFDEEDVERLIVKFGELITENCEVPRRLIGVAVVATARK